MQGTDGRKTEDNRIDAVFNDNYGSGLFLESADRTTGDLRVVSTFVRQGSAAVGTDGAYIDAASFRTDLQVAGRFGIRQDLTCTRTREERQEPQCFAVDD